jgi:hypothetical protein
MLHGLTEIPTDVRNILSHYKRPLQVLVADSAVPFGAALNQATEAASGPLIAKMDDDDWYGVHHIEDLVLAREFSGASLVGSQVEFSYLEGPDITTRRRPQGERFFNHVAGGTMLMSKSDLLALGGWRPISSAVDRGVIDAFVAAGKHVYRSHGQNYVMHRRWHPKENDAHTWDADAAVFVADSVEQWQGFRLPPQIDADPAWYQPPGRALSFRSRLNTWSGD